MNREIKFRAWDGRFMINPFCELRDGKFWSEDLVNTPFSTPVAVMQFTGYYDWKTKAEIYEGDRVKCFDYSRSDWYEGTVVFDCAAFCVKIEKCVTDEIDLRNGLPPYFDKGDMPAMYEFERFEVIGNIFTNPE